MKGRLAAYLLLPALLMFSNAAWACNCLPQSAAQEALKGSSYVMVAEVLEKTRITLSEIAPDYREFKVKVRVRHYWKGSPKRFMLIRTPEGVEECGAQLEVGKRYLIYAVGTAMPLVTSCSRTIEADSSQAHLDERQLGPAVIPEEE